MIQYQLGIEGIEFLKGLEGCKLKAYQDSKGVWTIGYGTTKNVKPGMVITQTQADYMFLDDLRYFEKEVNRLGVCKSQYQYAALVSFAYNVGVANLRSSTLLIKIKANAPVKDIKAQLMRWVYVTKTVKQKDGTKKKVKVKVQGLVNRREKEAAMWARK